MPKDKSVADVKVELESMLASELARGTFSHRCSDGSAWPLALKDVVARRVELEMAYSVNDYVVLRWGAPAESEEASTCRRRASEKQRRKWRSTEPGSKNAAGPARLGSSG